MKKINVTEPYLPPFEEYVEYLRGIWDRNWLTNQGPLVRELEQKLQEYHRLNVLVHCVANGSLGLQIALKALGVKGEVITAPFSYVATVSCPIWEGCSLRYADIEPDSLTINPLAVEAAITPQTEAILATHVFGNPCDVEALEVIAAKHGLALIFDAAHAFGVRYKDRSLLEYGDVSMVSLHATKLMHSVEGGFLVSSNQDVAARIEWMRRFGHCGFEDFHGVGINAKMSEFHAAMGLCNLKYLDRLTEIRKDLVRRYEERLFCESRLQLEGLSFRDGSTQNCSYFPIIFNSESDLLKVVAALNQQEIFPRRYFYPSLNLVSSLIVSSEEMPESSSISKKILCLPLSASLTTSDVDRISNIILNVNV